MFKHKVLKSQVKKISNKNNKSNTEVSKFNLISKNKFSMKLNDDLSDYIKNEVMKYDLVTANTKISVINLIKLLIPRFNRAIFLNKIIELKYSNSYFIPEKHFKIVYDIVLLVLKEMDSKNKLFRIEKYKFSKVRKYFIYKIALKYLYIGSYYEEEGGLVARENKYLVIDYSKYEEDNILSIYSMGSLKELKKTIKENFKILDPITNQEKSVSLNKSAKSHSAKSSRSSRSSNSSRTL